MATPPLHLPSQRGVAALDELDRVNWGDLDFAYTGDGRADESADLAFDVKAALRATGEVDWYPGTHALYSNIFHQRTVYEATAYAVPFLAAVAAGPQIAEGLRIQLVIMLTDIAMSSSIETADGGMAGAFGDDVAERIRAALLACAPMYDAIAEASPVTAPAFPAILVIAKDPDRRHLDPLLEINRQLVDRPTEPAEIPAPAGPVVRYRHPKLGDATLVRKQDNGLLLRFDDGKERVIRESFVTLIS
jgi:hypothetical protein